MLFNAFPLVNTYHALGFSAFLIVDALTFFRCHLRAIEMRLNAMFSNCWNIKCLVHVLAQIGEFVRVSFQSQTKIRFWL